MVAETRRAEAGVRDKVAEAHGKKVEIANQIKIEKGMIKKKLNKFEKMYLQRA